MDNTNSNKEHNTYKESSGTGVLAGIIFLIASIIVMYILSKYL